METPKGQETSHKSTDRLNRTMQYGNEGELPFSKVGEGCLNRTMQYGNLGHGGKKTMLKNCLNRTMQYGNSMTVKYLERTTKRRFKSYYVVWKPHSPYSLSSQYRGLNRTMQYGNCFFCVASARGIACLNRTMQHGNLKLPVHSCTGIHRLNRTMQYGNHLFSRCQSFNRESLNRTMQYGNFKQLNRFDEEYVQFKSYYVVWKPYRRIMFYQQ